MTSYLILIVDDHNFIRASIMQFLSLEFKNMEFIEAETLIEAKRILSSNEYKFDCVIWDIELPDGRGLLSLKETRKLYPEIKFLVCSGILSPSHIEEIFNIGANGFYSKRTGGKGISLALRQILNGESFVSPDLYLGQQRAMPSGLTKTEDRVALLVCDGLSNKEIARHLGISDSTVKVHVRNIYQKLNVPNRSSLIKTYHKN